MLTKIKRLYWRYVEHMNYWYMLDRIDAQNEAVSSNSSSHDVLLINDFKYQQAFKTWEAAKKQLIALN